MGIFPTGGYSLDDVKQMVRQMLPRGPIWRSAGVTSLAQGISGWAYRASNRVVDLLAEAFGSTASETLNAWGREYGLLDDPCTPWPSTETEQQALVHAAEIAQGGQDAAYYTAIAAALGVAITIEEGPTAPYLPPECGVAQCGDELAGTWAGLIWRVTAPAATPSSTRAALECLINDKKPAHTLVEYVYA